MNNLNQNNDVPNSSTPLISQPEPQIKSYFNPKKFQKHDFDIQKYISKQYCTSLYFGTDEINQLCYICPICNPSRDRKICKFCYENCHSQCRSLQSYDSNLSKEVEISTIKKKSFACQCALKLKHRPPLGDKSELIPCNLVQLDNILGINSIFCKSHQIQICCICSVTCHKKCNIHYDYEILPGNCICRSEFHTQYNELALSFPFQDFKEKTGVALWKIQTLNILFKSKVMFVKMEDLFIDTLSYGNSIEDIDESFFALLDLLNRNLNNKFKIYYFDSELLKMFNYENCMKYIKLFPNNNSKIVLSKIRLIFIVMLIHLKSDYQNFKTLTVKDLITRNVMDRLSYKLLLDKYSEINNNMFEKYNNRNIDFDGLCKLFFDGLPLIQIELNYNEIETTIKYIISLLKHMNFNNYELQKLINSIYPLYDKFYNLISNEKNNIYNYLGIYNAFSELFLEIAVNYNDNVVKEFIEKGKTTNNFIHKRSEEGDLLFRMIIKSTEILKRHYRLLQKKDIDDSIEEKNRVQKIKDHKKKFEKNSENQKVDIHSKLPENGALIPDKNINFLNQSINIFCLADNFYNKQLEKISKEDIEDYNNLKKKLNLGTYGNFYNNLNDKKDNYNSILVTKQKIESALYNLFDGPLRDENLQIGDQITDILREFIKETIEKFGFLTKNKKNKKNNKENEEKTKTKFEYFLDKVKYDVSKELPFVSLYNFDEEKENLINSLCLYSLDETISKLLIFFTMRNFPPLMTIELLETTLSIFQLYILTKNGMKFLLLGKNFIRICKAFSHYQCMKDSKNSNPKYNINTDRNIPFAEKVLKALLNIGKAKNYYNLSLKGDKGILKLKKYLIEHLQYLFEEKSENPKFDLIQKHHFYLCVKTYLLFSEDFMYEDFEDIKIKLMYLFLNSPFDLTEKNKFIKQYDNVTEMNIPSNNSSFHIHLPKKKIRNENEENKNKDEFIIYEVDDDESRLNKLSKTELMIDESTIFMKIYLKFFNILTKNTYFVFQNSEQEKYVDEVFNINSISGFQTLFNRKVINLEEKKIILNFIRTFTFLEHLDRTDLFSNKKPLTNLEFKEIVYNNIIDFESLKTVIKNPSNNDFNIEQLTEKYNHLALIEEVLDLFITEIKEFPSQIYSEAELTENIYEYIKELVLDVKFIGDYFFSSKDIAYKILPKFYLLTDVFLKKVDVIKDILNDIEKNNAIKPDYEIKNNVEDKKGDKKEKSKVGTTEENLFEIHRSSFNIYDKDKVYSYLLCELDKIFKTTNINKTNSLVEYLDKFDTNSETNFTPFSLVEEYDYEFFYEDEEEEKKEKKDKIKNLIENINKIYTKEFIDVSTTNFFQVFTQISNDSMKIDYRRKIVDYYHYFINSKEAYYSEKLENLTCLIDKLLFYNSEGMQSRFYKIKSDKFFFPNFNMELHQFVILSIISSRNFFVTERAEINISITKLLIQFLQLLGEGFNINYHENIFKLQKDVHIKEILETFYTEEFIIEEKENFNNDNEDLIFNSPILRNSIKKGEEKKAKKNKKNNLPKRFSSEENTIIIINETIYFSLIMNLKKSFGLININKEINGELPNDKLIVLLTNIIDFLIQFIDSNKENKKYIFEGINELFFGERFKEKDFDLYRRLEKEETIKKAIFSKIIDGDIEKYNLRRKIICYVKNKYIQLLISFFQSEKHENTFLELFDNGISTVTIYNELLYHFLQCLLNLEIKNKKLFQKIEKIQSDEDFVKLLLNTYIKENILKEIIEFQLCLNIFILLKILNERFKYNELNTLFETIESENYIQKEKLSKDLILDVNSYFSKRVYLFFNQLIIQVEIKTGKNMKTKIKTNEEKKEILNNISKEIYKGINLSENEKTLISENSNEENNNVIQLYEPTGNNRKLKIQYPQNYINLNDNNLEFNKKGDKNLTSIIFFIRPPLSFRLSEQSKISFEKNVDRSNATSKFISLINYSDYSLFEMIVNQHLLGSSSIKEFLSNINYLYVEIINFVFIIIGNLLIMYHFYLSPSLPIQEYDVIKNDDRYFIHISNFIVSIIHLAFLFFVILNWFYFKYILEFQSKIMRRYNKNFVFRKKNQGLSIPNVIVNYFQDMSMSSLSLTTEKDKDLNVLQLIYVGLFETIFFNRIVNILFFSVIFNILYILLENSMFIAIQMIFIINLTPTLFDIFRAIKMRFLSLITVIIFTVLIAYIYMWITYFYFDFLYTFDDIREISSNQIIEENFCNSSLQCFLFIIQQGFIMGGGLAEVLKIVSYQNDPAFFIGRFFYDIIFFLFIILILFNVFMGIIVDTFAELRDMNWNRENDINNICFICQMSRDDCLIENIDFDKHIKGVHNLWNYCYFLTHLHINNPNDFNSVEKFVWDKLEEQNYSWLPLIGN